MKTWKQGFVGKLRLSNGNDIYIKCLKYPLAVFYQKYAVETNSLEIKLFFAFVDLSVLKYIDRFHQLNLTSIEKTMSRLFSMDYRLQLLNIDNDLPVINKGLLKLQDIENCINQK